MKLTIATLLLSPVFVFASADSKAAKLAKAKFPKMSKSYGGNMCMSTSSSMSMSVGPEPPITLTACGESFTNQKVVLTNDLDCGSRIGDQEDCAVTLDGPFAEINCDGKTLSQVASSPGYAGGPFIRGICLNNGAKARNCNVQQFTFGIFVTDGAEVVNSDLSSNTDGIFAQFTKDSTLTIENVDASNNDADGLNIAVRGGANTKAKVIVKGKVTFNSNGYNGMKSLLKTNTNLEINVESGSTLNSCGNVRNDIEGIVQTDATLTFTGAGSYTCSSKNLYGDSAIVEPACQACPVP